MTSDQNNEVLFSDDIWVISEGRFIDLDLSCICDGLIKGPVKEYRISDLGKYLLNPNPIEVIKNLVGYEILYQQSFFEKIKEKIRQNKSIFSN